MRIGLVTPAWPGTNTANGITKSVANMKLGLEACGHDVTVIAMKIDAAHSDHNVIPIKERRWTFTEKIQEKLGDKDIVHKIISEQILHATKTAIKMYGVEALLIEETHGWAGNIQKNISIPVFVTLHGPWFLHKSLQAVQGNCRNRRRSDMRREAREKAALQVVAGITAPSQDVLSNTRNVYGIPDIPHAVIPNPMPMAPPVSVCGDEIRKKLLFVGRYDLHKGGDVVIEAFRLLAEKYSDCLLTFVGPDRGIPRPEGGITRVADALRSLPPSVRGRLNYLGQRSKADIDSLRQTHGITVIASRYETFGNVATEAMAVGSAIVCTKAGGLAEILRHEETGLLVPPGDPAALADACARLLGEPGLAPRLGAAARKDVEKSYSPEVVGQMLAEFLVDVTFARVARCE